MTNTLAETGEKGMTHEAGIEAALKADDRFGLPMYEELEASDINAIIQAYLSASGMVLVGRTDLGVALNSLRHAHVIMGESGSYDRLRSIDALVLAATLAAEDMRP